MKNLTRVRIRATPREIWPWVAHPDGLMTWSEKLVGHDAPPLERLHRGARFRVTYEMSRRVETWAEITAWEPPHRVEYRYRDDPTRGAPPRGPSRRRLAPGGSRGRGGGGSSWVSGLGRDGWATDELRLVVDGEGTRVERTLEIHAPAIPWPVRLLIGLLFRFGRPVDGTQLERLRRVVETGP